MTRVISPADEARKQAFEDEMSEEQYAAYLLAQVKLAEYYAADDLQVPKDPFA